MNEPTVLIVEDDPSVGNLIRNILAAQGIESEIALDGMAALDSLSHATPNLVILDIALPRVDGWEVLNTLQQAQRRIPVIVVTAHAQGAAANRALAAGASRFFEKPFVPAQLVAAVQELLAAGDPSEPS